MKKLLLAICLMLLSVVANATVTGSCALSRTTGVAPLSVFLDCSATTSTVYPTGTGAGYLTSAAMAQGTTAITVNTGSGTIVQNQDHITFTTTPGTGQNYVVNGAVLANDTTIPLITGSGTILAGNFIYFSNDTTHKLYRVTTGISAPGSVVITPGLGVGFTGGAAIEAIDRNIYTVTGTLSAGTVTIASPGLLFDGGVATSTPVTVLTNMTKLHKLQYETTWGDANGSPVSGKLWGMGANPRLSRNYSTGPLAAHVYESAGTYTITTRIIDAAGTLGATVTNTITVTDPNTYFSTTNTICIGANTDPTPGVGGCPAGADHHQQADFATAINTYALTGKRVLFKRGDTFTAATLASIIQTGPGIVGAFGTGSAPVVQMTGNTTILNLSSRSTPGISDWRVMDLELDGLSKSASLGVGASGGINQVTLMRLNIHDTGSGIAFSDTILDYQNSHGYPGHTIYDQVTIVDSSVLRAIGGAGNVGILLTGNRFSMLGNIVDDSTLAEHVVRAFYLYKSVISNNTLSRQPPLKLVVKIHGPTWCDVSSAPGTCAHISPNYATDTPPIGVTGAAGGYTEQVVISDNKIVSGDGTDWTVNTGPQDASSDERLRNLIIERNWFVSGSTTQVALVVNGAEETIRNNICNITSTTYHKCVSVSLRGPTSPAPPPANVRIYNNTFYSASAGDFVGVSVTTPARDTTIYNNLGVALLATTSPTMTTDTGIDTTGAQATYGNSSNSQLTSISPFEIAAPVNPTDFRVTPNSYAANNTGDGAVTLYPAIFDDFFHCKDVTGTNYRSGAIVPKANAVCRGAR